MELDNWQTTPFKGYLNEGLKGSSLEEAIPKETISSKGSEGLALSGVVALLDEVALPKWVAPSKETGWTNRDEYSNGRTKPGYLGETVCTEQAKGGTSVEEQTKGGIPRDESTRGGAPSEEYFLDKLPISTNGAKISVHS